MTYIDRAKELSESIKYDIDKSNEISLCEVEEWNHIVNDVVGGNKKWYDEYK